MLGILALKLPEIMAGGGFDAVIGNPPYIRIQALKEWAPLEVEYYKQRYTAASKGNYDIYVVFVEQALKLLNKSGRLGFISGITHGIPIAALKSANKGNTGISVSCGPAP